MTFSSRSKCKQKRFFRHGFHLKPFYFTRIKHGCIGIGISRRGGNRTLGPSVTDECKRFTTKKEGNLLLLLHSTPWRNYNTGRFFLTTIFHTAAKLQYRAITKGTAPGNCRKKYCRTTVLSIQSAVRASHAVQSMQT